MGVKILARYAMLGQYDFINLLQAPGNTAVARVATEFGSRGTLLTMTPAEMKPDEYIESIKK